MPHNRHLENASQKQMCFTATAMFILMTIEKRVIPEHYFGTKRKAIRISEVSVKQIRKWFHTDVPPEVDICLSGRHGVFLSLSKDLDFFLKKTKNALVKIE